MNATSITTIDGLSLDLATIKCIKLKPHFDSGGNTYMIIEHKLRCEYIFNPKTKTYEKQKYNDTTEIKYYNFNTAINSKEKWISCWEQHLNKV